MGRQAQRSQSTRGALIEAGRRLFAERGYTGTSTEDLVREAGVTRGALYHHFKDKRDLFAAVFEEVERDLTVHMATATPAPTDAWDALVAGCGTFLDACLQPDIQRIVIIDAPAVVGRDAWREIEEKYGLGLLTAALRAAMAQGSIAEQPVAPLAHLMLAALNEAGLLIARAEDTRAAREEVGATVLRVLEGLRADRG